MEKLNKILNYTFHFNKDIGISVKAVLVLIIVLILASVLLNLFKRLVVKRLEKEDKNKFDTVISLYF